MVGTWARAGWRVGLVALAGAALGVAAPAGAAGAAKRARPPAPQGWVVDRAVLEPLDGGSLTVAGRGEYRGTIEVSRGPGGGLAVINSVGFDDYLKGISEVPVSWPIEAQKAQAIAARTYLLHEMSNRAATAFRAAGADICATDSCQVYAGLEKERRPGAEAWSTAVDATRGQVLQFRGQPILAKYSSSNGGRTVAGGQPYLKAVDDPDDRRSPLNRWQSRFALAQVAGALGLPGHPSDVHRDGESVVVVTAGPDGSPTETRLAALDFRARLNSALDAPPGLPLALPSLRFGVATSEGMVVVDGQGWGHGIGLSQHGALGKALRGLRAPDILAAYYGGIRPVVVPESGLPRTVRVALDTGSGLGRVGGGGRFRVTDGGGAVIAHSTTGQWTAVPGPRGRGIRVVPPGPEAGQPSAVVEVVDPGRPAAGGPLSVRIRLDGPAALTGVQLVDPTGRAVELDSPVLRPPGPFDLRLEDRALAGSYTVVVDRDAGGGRTTTSAAVVEVHPGGAGAVPGPAVPAAAASLSGAVKAGASSLVLAVVLLALACRNLLRAGPGRAPAAGD